MFQRLGAILESEIETLGCPRAALLVFTTAVLAYNVLTLLKRSVKKANRDDLAQGLGGIDLPFDGADQGEYEGMQIALPPEYMPVVPIEKLAQRLTELARNIQPKQIAKSTRGPKLPKPKAWVQGTTVHAHVSTDRVIKAAKTKRS